MPVQTPLRLGFAGTPEFAATILAALISAGMTPAVVFTQPDRPVGRGRKSRPSPVKRLAGQHQIEVREPPTLAGESLREDRLDLLIVAAYGLILPPHVLSAPRLGCLNVHASLLPRWRGAAPVERAIMAGDTETGVCLMQMDEGLDTGPVFCRAVVPITDEVSGGELERQLAVLGGRLLVDTLPELESLTPVPQPAAGACYARKITRRDAQPDWTDSSTTISRQIRALSDRAPVTAFLEGEPGLRIRLLAARPGTVPETAPAGTVISSNRHGINVACGSGTLEVTRLQLNRGKGKPLAAADAVNGYPQLAAPGARWLSTPEPAAAADADS